MKSIEARVKNSFGFHCEKRILVIESDDWGSIRTSSTAAVQSVIKNSGDEAGCRLSRYYIYDSLETGKDLEALFEVLYSFKDSSGNSCKMTPMFLTANPDFELISKSNFCEYFYEPITKTYAGYNGCEKSFELIKQGIYEKVFSPQFHGREHLNTLAWIKKLQIGDIVSHLFFKNKMWGSLESPGGSDPYYSLQAAFQVENPEDIEYQKDILVEGLNLFEKLFGYRATFFTPPNGPLSTLHNEILAELGIKFIQTARILYREPLVNGKTRFRFRYLGMRNRNGQLYFIRNAFFEPSEPAGFSWVDKCLGDVRNAFESKKPAIISTHRVNYIGSIDPTNRVRGLKQLETLLKTILKTWPDVIFMTSDELGHLILKG